MVATHMMLDLLFKASSSIYAVSRRLRTHVEDLGKRGKMAGPRGFEPQISGSAGQRPDPG